MKILSPDVAQYFQSESIRRGKLTFTSFLAREGKPLFLDEHLDRLLKGAHFLFPERKWPAERQSIKNHLGELLKADTTTTYVRINIFDEFITFEKKFLVEGPGYVKLTTAISKRSIGLLPAFLKLSQYVEADLEIENARRKGFDDVVYLDMQDNLTECSTSNLFVVDKNKTIITPPLSSMVLDGVLRKKLMEFLSKVGQNISERTIHLDELQDAREVWMTNSIKGWRNVVQFEGRKFEGEDSQYQKLKSQFGQHGEHYE